MLDIIIILKLHIGICSIFSVCYTTTVNAFIYSKDTQQHFEWIFMNIC